MPRRRSTVATSRRASARSRSGSDGKPGMRAAAVELVVERAAAPQHAFEDVGGDPARGEALRVRRWGRGIHALLSHEFPRS